MKSKLLFIVALLVLLVGCKKDEPINSASEYTKTESTQYYILTINNTDATHRYEVVINNGEFDSVIVSKNSTIKCKLPENTYNVKLNQLDYFFYPTNYDYTVYLYSNKTITID